MLKSSSSSGLLPYHYQTNLRINFNKTSQAEATIDHNGFTTVQIRMSVLMEGCSITTEIKMGWVGSSGPRMGVGGSGPSMVLIPGDIQSSGVKFRWRWVVRILKLGGGK